MKNGEETGQSEKALKWYIVKTKSHCEARAREAISRLVKDHQMDGMLGDILIPEKEVIEVVKGKKVSKFKKFYPGYVFIQMHLTDQLWYLIKSASHVVNFVGKQGEPTEVPLKQIEAISHQLADDKSHPQAKMSFAPGEHVKVIDGPFNSFGGVVEEVNQEKARVKVSVSIFGRPTPVELDFSQVHREE